MLLGKKIFLCLLFWTLAFGCSPANEEPKKARHSKEETADVTEKSKKLKKPNAADENGKDNDDADDDDESEKTSKSSTPKEKQRIEFRGSKGDKVPGYLWLPSDVTKKKSPAILLMYGISDDKDSGTIDEVARELAKKGYVSLTIDWPGTGERGTISKQDRAIKASVKDWTVADYGEAVKFLVARPEVDPKKIAYIGASMGAMTGLAFAAKDTRIKAVVAIVPIPNPLWGTDDPMKTIQAMKSRPVLCISTQDNRDLSGLVCQNNSSENKQLSGGHELEGMHGEVIDLTEAFLKRSLR